MSGHAGKVSADHLARAARVYVRQSTLHQTRVNTESLQRQYELVDRVQQLGWAADQVRVIDADLGMSGAEAADREGFQDLVAEVGLGRVGLILGIEASRLARRNADWYALLDLCTLTDTLIGDADGVYDPADYSDRLVLGLKGTISEAELHLIKGRLIAGLRHKAARGELRINLPAGYDYGPDGQVVQSPDEAVRESVVTVFRRFFELRSIRQVAMSLLADGLTLPRRRGQGRTEWALPTYTGVHDLLVNPTYAGAFAYGRRQAARRVGPDGGPGRRWCRCRGTAGGCSSTTTTSPTSPGRSTRRSSARSPATGRCPARAAGRLAKAGRCCRGCCAADGAAGRCTAPIPVSGAGPGATTATPARARSMAGPNAKA